MIPHDFRPTYRRYRSDAPLRWFLVGAAFMGLVHLVLELWLRAGATGG